ncbi:uncharacterized protein LOC134531267 [Bacillus rossius redtenbacheri]|uniref:uncharacterized protein LOC134531267 n=1 Tax=Bacillus rossius redtenbacheri TaxID=93214 RepID=UPI002FDD8A4F
MLERGAPGGWTRRRARPERDRPAVAPRSLSRPVASSRRRDFLRARDNTRRFQWWSPVNRARSSSTSCLWSSETTPRSLEEDETGRRGLLVRLLEPSPCGRDNLSSTLAAGDGRAPLQVAICPMGASSRGPLGARPPLLLAAALLLLLAPGTSPLSLSHWELEGANETCDGRAVCDSGAKSPRSRSRAADDLDWRERNCLCDELCARYGDCCLDSPHFVPSEQRRGAASFSCVELRQFGGVYMRDSCPPGWPHRAVRDGCEAAPGDWSDPLAAMPVTSHRTGVTYRNPSCALCHGDLQHNTTDLWGPRLECPTLHLQFRLRLSEVTNSLVYSPEQQSWGLNLTDTGFKACHVDPVMPETAGHVVRRCQPDIVRTCAVNWTNSEVRHRCEAYTSLVYNGGVGYRNPHCAVCNNVPIQYLACTKSLQRSAFNKEWSPAAFAVLFDLSGGGDGAVGKMRACSETSDLYDPFFQRCRSVVCPAGREFSEGSCIAAAPSPVYEVGARDSNHSSAEILFHHLPGEDNATADASLPLLECPKFLLSGKEFMMLGNESIFVPQYERIFQEGEYWLVDGGGVEICAVPLGLELVDKFGPYMGYVTMAGLGVSVVFLCLHLLAFAVVPEMRNLSGKNLASLCLALLLGYLLFISSQFLARKTPECVVVGTATYYLFLSSFFWMLTMAFDVWHTLRLATLELRVSAGRQWRKFACYSAVAWGAPGLVVLAAGLVDAAGPGAVLDSLRPAMGRYSCWFGSRDALLAFFAAPLAVVMALNMGFFASSAYMIYATTSTARYTSSSNTRRDFRLYVRLALVMGLAWTVGLVAGSLDMEGLWYAFIALNTLQGLFIFLAFTCTDKVIRAVIAQCEGSCPCRGSSKVHRPPSFSWSGTSSSSTHKSRLGSSSDGSTQPRPHGLPDTLY